MIAGRYALEREIGRGGMGAVWLGRDEVLGRAVALKRIGHLPGLSEGPDLQRAEREARLAARLNHPHVVSVFDLVMKGDERWLVMEYVEGLTLARLIQRDGRLTPDRAAPLIRQVAEALAAAHEAGIVHRDVKPSNIMVSSTGQVKLADFGIARAHADASLTVTGLVTGSPAYLAPEVATGTTATESSDVWSLGATLFHALAGHPPYQVGDNVMGTLYRIVHEEPPRLSDAGWLSPLLEHTMDRDPGARWSMRRVVAHLARGPVNEAPRTRARRPGAEENATALLPAASSTSVPAAPMPVTAPERARTTEPPSPAARPGRGRRPLVPILLAVGVVLLAAVLAASLGDDDAETPASGATTSPTGTAGSTSPSATVAGGRTDAQERAAMVAFVEDYLDQVTTDPEVTWQMLTPDFQEASRGFSQYARVWGEREIVDYGPVKADPESLVVSYPITYESFSDEVKLQLEKHGDSFLIAGEA